MNELPFFKYNPKAVELEIIVPQNGTCNVCEKERNWVYQGPFYSTGEVGFICPWCIKDGSAAKKYHGEFQDVASCEPVESQDYITELTTQTPGYSGWQQEKWLSHCGDFCAFWGFVGWSEIKEIAEELKVDLNKIKSEQDLTQIELESLLENEGRLQGYLFKCIHCNQPRITVDRD